MWHHLTHYFIAGSCAVYVFMLFFFSSKCVIAPVNMYVHKTVVLKMKFWKCVCHSVLVKSECINEMCLQKGSNHHGSLSVCLSLYVLYIYIYIYIFFFFFFFFYSSSEIALQIFKISNVSCTNNISFKITSRRLTAMHHQQNHYL